jgi:aryl-alcohol dehydrogenase-like predicted oxidoreductase
VKYRRFAPLGRDLSVLVLGTTVWRAVGDDASTELLDAWVELGGNVVDCGREYGTSERILGRWLHQSGRHDDVAVLTKGAHQSEERRRVTPADITADLLESLDVLGRDTIELYLLHRDDPSQPVGPIVEILNEHRHAGRIGCFGGSNWTTERLAQANEYAAAQGLEGFSCSSPGLSLARQNEPPWADCVAADTEDARRWYERTGLPLFAWSSQAAGFFAGVTGPDVVRVYGSEPNVERLRRATELGERTGHTANQVALAWVLANPFPTHAIIGPRTIEELLGSVAALELELTPQEWRWLNLETDDVTAAGEPALELEVL